MYIRLEFEASHLEPETNTLYRNKGWCRIKMEAADRTAADTEDFLINSAESQYADSTHFWEMFLRLSSQCIDIVIEKRAKS